MRFISAISLFLLSCSFIAIGQGTRNLERENAKLGTERRTALVIGNAAYQHAPRLANPVNDAHDIAAALKDLGFEVLYGEDQSGDQMKRLIKDFGAKLKAGGKGLFYYAGHGIQLNGRNYLIPVEIDSLREGTIEFEAVDVNRVLAEMDAAGNGFNIVILDACRNNPFSRSWRDTAGGLASISAPTGTFIAYSTAPNSVASDGTGRNGLYTQELLKQLRTPNLVLEEVFKQVRTEVRKKSNSQQVPWESSSVEGIFYFSVNRNESPIVTQIPVNTNAKSADEAANKAKPDSSAFELSFWDYIKNSSNINDFDAYLKKYPNGQFTDLAKNRLIILKNPALAHNDSSTNKPPAGAWVVPSIDGDSNCLDEPCKTIRKIVAAAPTDFKSMENVYLPGFQGIYCKVIPPIEGLAPTFYYCPNVYTSNHRQDYDKYLSALGRALPGWFFKTQKILVGSGTWEIAMIGPKECTLETCPVTLRLFDRERPYGQLVFEVEKLPGKTGMISESFKKQFIDDIRAMFTAADSDFRTPSVGDQSFTRHSFDCIEGSYTDHRNRSCDTGHLPFGQAERLVDIARQTVMEQKPDSRIEDYKLDNGRGFRASPATCSPPVSCGAQVHWSEESYGSTFSFSIDNPAYKKH